MEFIGSEEKNKKVRLDDDEIYEFVLSDKQRAERYFNSNVAPAVILRYDLLHANSKYYESLFPELSKQSSFTSSDVKDIVEWMMPSFTEVYFGAEKIIGIFGRSPEDDVEPLEKVIQFQTQTQNKGYQVIDQWVRDAIEAGLGVMKLTWQRRSEKKKNWYRVSADEYYSMDEEAARRMVKDTRVNPDGTYDVLVEEEVVTTNQPVMENLKPGEYIFDPDTDSKGRHLFECHRRKVPYDEILRRSKTGEFRNVDKDFPLTDPSSEENNTMSEIEDAINNYAPRDTDEGTSVGTIDGQEGRKLVVLNDCWGFYDVDGDGLLEYMHVVVCNGVVLKAEVWEHEVSPFFKISFYAKSYQHWKEGVADYLQDIQDLKTALTKQAIVNTTLNNRRQFAIDERSSKGVEDVVSGRQVIRLDLMNGGSVRDFIQVMPKCELDPNTFGLIEQAGVWSEQKTGITKYNQGLDSDSLNKTATGITKIMAASQQRLRKMARDGAENGLVPMYKHLIELNVKYLDSNFTFRVANEFFEFSPDDIKGEFDVQITSNIGLQDKQLTIQNLMTILSSVLPMLLQIGIASPVGLYNTAKQLIQEMGFNNSEKYLGIGEDQMLQQQQLPLILTDSLIAQGLAPEVAQQVALGATAAVRGGQVDTAPTEGPGHMIPQEDM